jgi:hypothetical protein
MVVNKVQKFQIIFHDIAFKGMVVNESFQAVVIIKKLSNIKKTSRITLSLSLRK